MFKTVQAGTSDTFEERLNVLEAKYDVDVIKTQILSNQYGIVYAWVALVRCTEKPVRVETTKTEPQTYTPDGRFGYQ